MIHIQDKTIQDLQFHTVLEMISSYCITDNGKENAKLITPFRSKDALFQNLSVTQEYLSSFQNNNPIPNHGFETIAQELKLLGIENSSLELASFRKIKSIAETTFDLSKFLNKNEEFYPELLISVSELLIHKEITTYINAVIDKYGEVKDDASPDLLQIRNRLKQISGKINQSFSSALSYYSGLGYLDEIRESVVDNRRVLAVMAMYRKKVKGQYLGSSKTGSIAFIEPEQTLNYTREFSNLKYEEKEVVDRILQELTRVIRPFKSVLESYQSYLLGLDILYAKAKYAQKINGVLPVINENKRLFFKDAYHPILWLTHQQSKQKTHAQTIELLPENRIIVISGPNAGGKSITLKTIGLLQLMLQSGILIPVHPASETFLFDRILTDIGDNQSIENHLSTYSYRLKNMNYFLKKCNSNTLFLIDEFGTGSDPELGGALAEIFLEEFYHREAFGIITTHYSNLKLLADELPFATNANMLFDAQTLLPTFQLNLGQAGSSFTFEVAQKNGIPFSLINRAKKKIEKGKVRFDKTIANMQKEHFKLEKTTKNLKDEERKAREEGLKMEEINSKIQQKLERYQELFDANQRLVYLGQKIDDYADKYFNSKNKKELISSIMKLVEIENSKKKPISKKEKIKEVALQKELIEEVELKVAEIRTVKKEKQKQLKIAEVEKPKKQPKVGDRVRMINGKAIGELEQLQKGKATVNYGMFVSHVAIEELEYVETKKTKK